MPRLIAFLRAINVGGHTVKMERLRALFTEVGLERVETFIASGNVIFEAEGARPEALEKQIEAHLQQALGYAVATFIRTPAELAAVSSYQPFPPAELEAAGVRRVSLGGSLSRVAYTALKKAGEELLGPGTFGFGADILTTAAVNKLMSG